MLSIIKMASENYTHLHKLGYKIQPIIVLYRVLISCVLDYLEHLDYMYVMMCYNNQQTGMYMIYRTA